MASARSATASTGDLRNNTMKLLREIQRMKLPLEPDVQGLTLGCPSAFLPVLHSSFMHYSLPLAKWLTRHGYDLYSKTDLRFLEGMYKVMRDVFHYRPQLTREQFLSTGFTERKVLLTLDVLCFCQAKHRELVEGRGRGRGRGRRRGKEVVVPGKGPESLNISEKPEILTIQEWSGISSAWTEPLRVEVESAGNSHTISQPSLPSPPPHSLTTVHSPLHPANPTTILEVTPNPTPLKHPPPGTSLPPSTPEAACRLVPESASHGEEIHGLQSLQPWPPSTGVSHPPGFVVRHPPPPCSAPGQHPPPCTDQQAAAGNVAIKSDAASEGDAPVQTDTGHGVTQGTTRAESPESWHSLPLRREEEVEVEEGTATTQSGAGAQLDTTSAPLGDISIRVEQLAQQVEKMTARFFLLETRLKMADSPRSDPAMGSTKRGEDSLTQRTEPTQRATSVCTRDLQRSLSPLGSSKEPATPPSRSDHSSPRLTRTEVTASGTLGTPSLASSVMMRDQLTQPHNPILHTHTSSLTPSASLQLTPHRLPLWSQITTPSTPGDTRLMIENLRNRAQRTRDLLQKINTAHGRSS